MLSIRISKRGSVHLITWLPGFTWLACSVPLSMGSSPSPPALALLVGRNYAWATSSRASRPFIEVMPPP